MTLKKHAHPNVKGYLMVFGTLMFLTVVTVLVSYVHLAPTAAVIVGLGIAIVKASLVAAFFMHLKGEQTLILVFLGFTLVAFSILVIIPITDTSATSHKLIHAEGPAAEAEH